MQNKSTQEEILIKLNKILNSINIYNHKNSSVSENIECYGISASVVDTGGTAMVFPLKNAEQILKLVDVRACAHAKAVKALADRQDFLRYRLQEIEYLNKVKGCPYIIQLYDAYEIGEDGTGEPVVLRRLDEKTDYAVPIDERAAYYILIQRYYIPLELYLYMIPLTEEDIYHVLEDMLHALQVLEAEPISVLHNDIRIKNVFVDMKDDGPHFVLGDFGEVQPISQGKETQIIKVGAGEVGFAPEFKNREKQGSNGRVRVTGFQSDIYLLGRLILTLYGSYSLQSELELKLDDAENSAKDGDKFDTRVINTSDKNEGYSRIIHKALRRDEKLRFANAQEMLNALAKIKLKEPRQVPYCSDIQNIYDRLELKKEADYGKLISDLKEIEHRNRNNALLSRVCRVLRLRLKCKENRNYVYSEEEIAFLKQESKNKNPEAMLLYARDCYNRAERKDITDEYYRCFLDYVEEAAQKEFPKACNWKYSVLWNSGNEYEMLEALECLMKAVLRGHRDAIRRMSKKIEQKEEITYLSVRRKLTHYEQIMKASHIHVGGADK